MSVRSDLMVQQYHVAKNVMVEAVDPENELTHDVSSHVIASTLYRIDGNKTEGITTRDRAVVYAYILRRIESGQLEGADTPEAMSEGITRLFNEFVDDFETDTTATEDYGKPFGGVALAIIELMDTCRETAEELKGIIGESEDLAIETIANFIDLTRQDQELFNIKEAIEETL